ncbi:hypothetical protein ACH4PU_35970 [Streptomyces sp. NPDC021100]|uniref:hypothetical protein n=1 Tax=Streptomyces sp. NPDC021100 TaxID=3365114 RepID=UPI00379658A0
MTAAAPAPVQTYTVIGFRLDVDPAELLVAAVLPGPLADDVIILATSEDDFTRWAMEFDADGADEAAAQAYEHCRSDPDWD